MFEFLFFLIISFLNTLIFLLAFLLAFFLFDLITTLTILKISKQTNVVTVTASKIMKDIMYKSIEFSI